MELSEGTFIVEEGLPAEYNDGNIRGEVLQAKDDSTSHNIVEEGPMVCPLCSSELKYFFINFNDKMLMCENVECEYPFGYDELQFIHDNDIAFSDLNSTRTKPSQESPTTASIISTGAWLDIDKMNKVFEAEEKEEFREYRCKKLNRESKDKLEQNVEVIKELSQQLVELQTPKRIICNEKWIKKLHNLQSISGAPLLKPQEINKLKGKERSEPELKINIEPGNNEVMSTIKIDIACNPE